MPTQFTACRHALLTAALLAAGAAPAAAQTPELPRLSLGAAVGAANPLHGDFDFLAVAWNVSARVRMSPRVALEIGIDQWRHTDTDSRTDVTLFGPDGPIGRAGRLSQTNRISTTGIAGALIGHAGSGAVRISAGGGGGIYTFRRTFRQVLDDCEASTPAICQETSSAFTSGRFGVLALFEAGFGTQPLQPFVQGRYELPDLSDAGSASVMILAGGRITLR